MSKQLRNIRLMAAKDLKLFASDRGALFFAILFPFLFVILFNFINPSRTEDVRLELNLATREPAGGMSYQIIAALETKDEAALKPGEPKFVWLKDYEQAKRDVEGKKLRGFLAFPEDFSEAVLMGYGCDLEVISDPSNPQAAAALRSVANSIASSVGTQQVVNNAVIGLLVEQELVAPGSSGDLAKSIRDVLMAQGGQPQGEGLVAVTTEKVGELEGENPANYVIPGYLVMFVFMTASFAAQQIVRERQNHTLERLMASSASRAAILGGVFTGTAAKGIIQIVLFWTVGMLVFKMDIGIAPAAVLLTSVLVVLMASAFGVMLATVVKTERSASSIGVLASLILAPLGGCWWPLFIVPRWMQFLAKFTPHGWATTGFNKLLVFGADFGAAAPEMIVIGLFAVAFGTIAIVKFRTDAE